VSGGKVGPPKPHLETAISQAWEERIIRSDADVIWHVLRRRGLTKLDLFLFYELLEDPEQSGVEASFPIRFKEQKHTGLFWGSGYRGPSFHPIGGSVFGGGGCFYAGRRIKNRPIGRLRGR
jgi:hypothetical protein